MFKRYRETGCVSDVETHINVHVNVWEETKATWCAKAIHQEVEWGEKSWLVGLFCPWSSTLWQLHVAKIRGRRPRACQGPAPLALGCKTSGVTVLTNNCAWEWRDRSERTPWLLPGPGRLTSCATLFRSQDWSLPRILHYIANDPLIDLMAKVHLKVQNPQQMTKCNDSYDCFLEKI